MKYSIGIFKDKKGNILVIPHAHDENGIGRDFSKFAILSQLYEKSDVGRVVRDCLGECIKEPFLHSKNAVKVYELATGIDNWATFSRGKQYVSGVMCSKEGFTFSQWKRYHGGAFGSEKGLKQFYFEAGFDSTDEVVGEAVLKAFDSPPVLNNDKGQIEPLISTSSQISQQDITRFLITLFRVFLIIRSKINQPYNSMFLLIIRDFLTIKNKDFIAFREELIDSLKMCDYFGLISQEEIDAFNDAISISNIDMDTDNIDEVNKYLPIIKDCITEICLHISEKNYERAYDLIDAIHCLPEALLVKHRWNAKVYWRIYMGAFRNKWEKNFMQIQEKEVVKASFWRELFH